MKRRAIAGSMIGGIAETQEMLDFCAEHGIVADIEMIRADQINESYERMLKGDVKYRFVIDSAVDAGGHISVRLADGLAAIESDDAITAITICGMGGETIRDILDSGKARLSGKERLILQPNGGEQPLRLWLMENGYRILSEELLRENRFHYEIIVAERAEPVTYSARELYFGPLQMQTRSPEFLRKWQHKLRHKQKTLSQLAHAQQGLPDGKVQDLTQQTRWISELLA
jgi:tRNA (adenine22-N1)-methyltransferase